jgi:hypothetical protein
MKLIPEYLPNTRYATCLICNAARRDGDRIIDLERWIDFDEGEGWGALAICETCGRELATLIGCAPNDIHDRLIAENQTLKAKIADLESARDRVKALL